MDRVLREEARGEALQRAGGLPRIPLDSKELSDLELIAVGAYSPLQGFMNREDYLSVVESMRLAGGTLWSLPVTLSAGADVAGGLKPGDEAALVHEDTVYGIVRVTDKYRYDPEAEARQVYGTDDAAHPGVARLYRQGEVYIGGEVWLVRRPPAEFPAYHLDPAQTRAIIRQRGWKQVAGFQTRNPVHRAHEYLQKCALEMVDGLLLHPLVGETKSDDIPAGVRMESYQVLLEKYYPRDRILLSVLPAAMRYAVGKKITELCLIKSIMVSLASGTLVVLASLWGIPVPMTQTTTMAIVGVGCTRGGAPVWFHVIAAKKVICATGGAAGIYRPNNPGSARHKTWYPPFNAGAGYAMGIRAGAEMTSFEMRFIALRVKDTMAPTGTVAQGVKAPQINSLGERYLQRYHPATTPVRLWATLEENIHGRGPCFLDTTRLTPEEGRRLKEAYLDMCPSMVLSWADRQREPGDEPLEITGSEPYLVGGHAQAGYWVDIHRQTTLDDLYAAGDVAGGAPKKYVTGSMVEGEIAARHAVAAMAGQEARLPDRERVEAEFRRVFAPLGREQGISPEELKEAMQKVMDEYAGGACSRYAVSSRGLMLAKDKLLDLRGLEDNLVAGDYHQLMQCHEVIDRLEVAQVVVEHLLHRRETRWPCYQTRLDHPERDDSRWLVFVNSRYERERGQVVMLERPVTEGCLYGSAD